MIGAKLTVTLAFLMIAVGSVMGMTMGAGSGTVFIAEWMIVLCAGTGLAAGVVLPGGGAEDRAAQRERIALILAVPALRDSLLGQFSQAMNRLAVAIAEREHRRPDDFAVRTVAGALVGLMMAVLAPMADDTQADVAALIDQAIAQVETGLSV